MRVFHAVRTTVAVIVLGSVCGSIAPAQDASSFWLVGIPADSCSYHPVLTLKFGNALGATYGVDTSLGEGNYGCIGAPPPPADILWSNIPGRSQEEYGICRAGDDFRTWSSPSQVDTFRLRFYTFCSDRPAFHFRWPDSAYIALRCDSMVLAESLNGSRISMMSLDSLQRTTDHGEFYILKYGAKLVDALATGVSDHRHLPAAPALYQNYPNPFNPTTTIEFQLPVRSWVRLTIHDLLGRVVTVLIDGIEEAGPTRVRWNAGGIASGVYCYRLESQSARNPAETSTLVRTLLLMR